MSKLSNTLKDFLKGLVIGAVNVIPGFSSGTIAVILGVYEKIIGAFSEIFHHPIKVIKEIWAIAIGVVLGIVIALFAIIKLLEVAPVQTVMFFVGLILGGIPYIYISTKQYGKAKLNDIIFFTLGVIILVVLPFISGTRIEAVSVDVKTIIILFLMGIIASSTMIIPGISGTLVLLILGYYFIIIESLNGFLESLISFDVTNLWSTFMIVFVFALGALIGLVFISKVIKWLLKKYPRTTYWMILGFVIASPFSIIYALYHEYPDAFSETKAWGYVLAFITMVLGTMISGYFSLHEKRSIGNKEE